MWNEWNSQSLQGWLYQVQPIIMAHIWKKRWRKQSKIYDFKTRVVIYDGIYKDIVKLNCFEPLHQFISVVNSKSNNSLLFVILTEIVMPTILQKLALIFIFGKTNDLNENLLI